MTLGNMRELGVQRLIASCLNDACRHQGLVDVSGYAADTEVLSREVRQVRRPRKQDRRTAQLERAAGADEADREGVPLNAPLARRYHPQH